MSERSRLLANVRMLGFAATDAALFLDTHPDDPQALAYFRKQQSALSSARSAFERKFGPLMQETQTDERVWNWIDGPWPWEGRE